MKKAPRTSHGTPSFFSRKTPTRACGSKSQAVPTHRDGDTPSSRYAGQRRDRGGTVRWPRLFGQILRLDKWIVCRG